MSLFGRRIIENIYELRLNEHLSVDRITKY
jgi:hypothetical protein